jgi:long-subunit acyl-CoA synthetase (AMP-forming)
VATTTGDPQDVALSALKQPSLCAAFQLTAAANAERPALVTADGSVQITWAQYADRVRAIAAGLASLGVGDGDCVALLLGNRPEFHLVDTAVMHLGATPFSIYHTNSPEQIDYVVGNADAKVLITEAAFLDRVLETRRRFGSIEHLVVVDTADGDLTLNELEARGDADFDVEAAWRAVAADHVATLVYTSGTTGSPKGAQHTHAGLLFQLGAMQKLWPISPEGRVVSYLPMAHIAERYISHYASLAFGYTITCCANPKELPLAITTCRPTRFFGVPRIYEKLQVAALAVADADPALRAAVDAGLARVRGELGMLSPEHEEALAGLRARLGLDQLEWCSVAAAPTPYSVLEFFHAIGVEIAELWGMTECLFATSNPPGAIKLGTVGPAAPGVEIRLADDGEILVRSPGLMIGYRNDPERTREAVDEEGFLHSGDVATCDEDGYFKVVDRKKEIIINSAGKNMSPAHIEGTIKQESPLIAQVVAIGDARQYVTALVVLDAEAAGSSDIAALASDEDVRAQIDAAIARANERLARVEQIKTYRILSVAWEPGGDELTPTMKLKRKPIAEKYAAEIEALYT